MFIGFVSDFAVKLFVCGLVLHWVIDWLGQNHYLAVNKSNLRHPAAYVHSGLHLLGLLLVFPWHVALVVAIIHLLIDTRLPLAFWRGFIGQTQTGEVALHVAIWSDQVLHIFVLAIASLLLSR